MTSFSDFPLQLLILTHILNITRIFCVPLKTLRIFLSWSYVCPCCNPLLYLSINNYSLFEHLPLYHCSFPIVYTKIYKIHKFLLSIIFYLDYISVIETISSSCSIFGSFLEGVLYTHMSILRYCQV